MVKSRYLNSDCVPLGELRHAVGKSFDFTPVVEVPGIGSVEPHVVGGAVRVVADLAQGDPDAGALVTFKQVFN